MFEFNEREKTVRETSTNVGSQNLPDQHGTTSSGSVLQTWRGFGVVEEFPAEGGEADIFVIQKGGEKFVLKLYRKGMEPKEVVLSKIKELSENLSKHVIRIYEYGFDRDLGRWYELQEFAPHGNLKQYLKTREIGNEEIRAILHEMNEGLNALHSAGIVHRDIKPSNILLRNSEPLNLVFTDFGISSVIDSDVSKKLTTVKGTPIYSAPEAFTGVMGKEVDYWSLGMIVYEALTGRNPLAGLSVHTVTFKLTTEGVPIPDVDERYKLLLSGLLARNPKERWGYEQVKAWLEGKSVAAPKVTPKTTENKPEAYKFMDRYYDDLDSLTIAFIESGESFELAKKHIMKGYLRTWLEKKGDFDGLARLDDAIENSKLAEEAVVRFVYTYHENVPLTLYGREITTEYLIDLLVSAQTNSLSPADERIYELVQKAQLSDVIQAYEISRGTISLELKTLVMNAEGAAKSGKLESFAKYVAFLKANQISLHASTALDPMNPDFDYESLLDEKFLYLLERLGFNNGVWFDGKRLSTELIQTGLGKALKRLFDADAGSTDLFDLTEDPYVQLLTKKRIFELIEIKHPQLSKTLRLYERSLRTVLEVLAKLEVRNKLTVNSTIQEFSKLGLKPRVALISVNTSSKEFISRLKSYGINLENPNRLPELLQKYDLVAIFVSGQSNVYLNASKLVFLTDNESSALEKPYHFVDIEEKNCDCASSYTNYLLWALSVENFVKRVVRDAMQEERESAHKLLHDTNASRERLAGDALDKIKEATIRENSVALLTGKISAKDIEVSLEKVLGNTFLELEREVKELYRKNSRKVIEVFLKLTGNEEKLNQLNYAFDSTDDAKRCASNLSSTLIKLLSPSEIQSEASSEKSVWKFRQSTLLLNVITILFLLGGCATLIDYADTSEAGMLILIGFMILVATVIRQTILKRRAESVREEDLREVTDSVEKIFDAESDRLRKLILEDLERYVSKVASAVEWLEGVVQAPNS